MQTTLQVRIIFVRLSVCRMSYIDTYIDTYILQYAYCSRQGGQHMVDHGRLASPSSEDLLSPAHR